MANAIELSRKGFPAPNPRVGCVIVSNRELVGAGFHEFAGGPHAEVVALREAGPRAKGADVYVTLEPCNHHGRTGPCSEALLAAGVKRVIYAVADPNRAAAGGAERLRSADVRVSAGLLAAEAADANRIFLKAFELGRPFVCVKIACTLDGKIANTRGDSKWITGAAAREQGHRLRAEMGAVLVGANTVLKDDPRLTARIPGVVNQPLRVVLDPLGVLHKGNWKLFAEPGRALRIEGKDHLAETEREACRRGDRSPELGGHITLPLTDARFDLNEVLQELWNLGVTSLLVEGGAQTVTGFIDARLCDRLDIFVAPKLMGEGLAWYQGAGLGLDAFPYALSQVTRLGEDAWLSFEPQ